MPRSRRRKNAPPSPASSLDVLETIEIKAGVFKNTCLELMDDVSENAREYVITKHGRPVAKLVPPDRAVKSAFGILRGTIVRQDDIIAPDFDAWGELT